MLCYAYDMIPNAPVSFWEYFDAVSLTALFIVITFLMITHRKSTGALLSTISETVAHSTHSSLIFSIVMTVFFPLYYAFLWFWLAPSLRMPPVFYGLLLLSALFEIVFVWMPANGKTHKMHSTTSGVVGILMLVAPILILAYGIGLDGIDRAAIYTFLSVSIISLGLLFFRQMREYTLHIEIIYCATFLAAMSFIAHR